MAHSTHCCIVHGCKYGDKDCTVVHAQEKQVYPCEHCSEDDTFDPVLHYRVVPRGKRAYKLQTITQLSDAVYRHMRAGETCDVYPVHEPRKMTFEPTPTNQTPDENHS